jgi:hypothetical protein
VEHSNRVPGRRLASRPVAALIALVAVAAGLRAAAALALPGPWLMPDEGTYALLARGFWHHADLAVLGGPSQFESALYPVLAGLPYGALRVLQAALMCSTAVVVYAWARSVARPVWALTAAALTLALPGLAYSGTIVAETLFVPLATLAAWLSVRALEVPSRRNQVQLVLVLIACLLTRGEANMLALALVVVALVMRRVRALAPTWIALVIVAGLWIGLGGGSPLRSVGGYGAGAGYSAHRVLAYVLEHAGELLLVSGVVPLCAVVLLALVRPAERAVRTTVALALALSVIAVVEVGVFAAGHADLLLERELLLALPPLLVGFAVWLDRGGPRPRLRTLGVIACAVAGLLAVPFGRLAMGAAAPYNPSLVPLIHLSTAKTYGVVALFVLVACALLLAVPVRRLWLLPALLAGVFAAVSVSASEEFVDRSQAARHAYAATAPGWLNRVAAGPVAYLYDGGPDWRLVWTQLFWNDRIVSVLDLPAAHVPGPLPQRQLEIIGNSGALRLVGGAVPQAQLIAAPEGFRFRGRRLVTAPSIGQSLWRVDSPPRIRTWAQGVRPNGDLAQGGVATLDVFDCSHGAFHIVAIGRDNETLRLAENGNPVAQTRLWPDGVWEQTVKTPAAAGARCTFSLSTTSLVHLSSFEWTPR